MSVRREASGVRRDEIRGFRFYASLLTPFALLLSLVAIPALARTGDGGSHAAEFLRLGTGARAPAVGDAWTAAPDGVLALHYNPAGLGWTDRAEIEGMYQKYVLDVGQGTLGFAHPIGERGAWGVSASYLDYGSTNRTTITNTGGVITGNNAGKFKGHDLAVGLSYGQHIADWSWGVTGKVISSSIDDASATAFAADLGLGWRPRSMPLAIGLTLQNLGSKMKYDVTQENLPLLGRMGVSYSFFKGRLRLNADVEKARNENVRFLGGGEYWIANLLALRVGYDGRKALDSGLTCGAGFRYQDFGVDYAFIPFGKFGNNHRMALNYRWGAGRGDPDPAP